MGADRWVEERRWRVSADDADYEDGVRCVVMPCCGFTFDACHIDAGLEPWQYTCPLCEIRPLNMGGVPR